MKSRLKSRHLKRRKRFGKVGNKQHLNNQPITKAECSQKSLSVFRRLWNFLYFIISALFGNDKQKTFTESFKNESFINQRIEDLENKVQKMSKQIKLIQKELEKKTSLSIAPPCAPLPPPPPPPPPTTSTCCSSCKGCSSNIKG
ncbi:unnamed protein product [Clavelina lepadiformis]|uniref:Agouti signaling protein n=1 Tax=Clavelina lepadiformis TaxID=159417 RepID=A0ABP0EWK8_CLALP